ncbi:13323_t:CDS:2, partial [Entrophospora sp. SA101]
SQLCESLHGSSILSDNVLDISMYLKFVNCENEIKQLIENMKIFYDLIENLKSYAEPKKQIVFPVTVGTSGKGKTTFARKEYENKDLYIKIIKTNTDSGIILVDIKGTWIGDDREKWQMEISGPPSTPTTCHTVSDMKKSIQIDILNLVGILSNHLDLDVKIAKEVKV